MTSRIETDDDHKRGPGLLRKRAKKGLQRPDPASGSADRHDHMFFAGLAVTRTSGLPIVGTAGHILLRRPSLQIRTIGPRPDAPPARNA
jgi:hypothetical protein